jgi:SAM-dependent methyltransferase
MNKFSFKIIILNISLLLFEPKYRKIFKKVSVSPRLPLRIIFASGVFLLLVGTLTFPHFAQAQSSTERRDENTQKLVTITNPKNSSVVGDDVTLLGRYAATISDDIWVIIWPEKTLGLGWPQYGDPLLGTSVNKKDGLWSVNAHFGDPPQNYEIAVYTSSQTASSFLQQQYKQESNQGKEYPGIFLTKLPDGLIEQDRIIVKKALNRSHPAKLLPLLKGIQDDLAQEEAKTGHNYYKDEYSKNEVYFWSEIAGWMVVDAIDRIYTKDEPVNQILDLGCGYGTLLAFASTIYGVDGICFDKLDNFGAYGVNNFNKKYHLAHVQGDIERGPLPGSKQFSVIIMTEVMEHLNFQPVPTLQKIYKVLAPGGSFFLSTPDADLGWGRNYKYYKNLSDLPRLDANADWIDDHIWHYNTTELEMVLQNAGFKIKKIEHSYNPSKEGYGHFNVWLTK